MSDLRDQSSTHRHTGKLSRRSEQAAASLARLRRGISRALQAFSEITDEPRSRQLTGRRLWSEEGEA